jgi:nucleotide-binding universal stress UspA family protein
MTGAVGFPVVVGFDGSEGAQRALDWAIVHAQRMGVAIELVFGVDIAVAASSPFGTGMVFEQLQESGATVLAQGVERVRAAGVEATSHVDMASPAQALITASKHASVVVVGRRGHGGFVGLLMGSVSSAVVHHAHCPVVVVPVVDR